jgi:hypothetical protein
MLFCIWTNILGTKWLVSDLVSPSTKEKDLFANDLQAGMVGPNSDILTSAGLTFICFLNDGFSFNICIGVAIIIILSDSKLIER